MTKTELIEENANLKHKLHWHRTKLHQLREENLILRDTLKDIQDYPDVAMMALAVLDELLIEEKFKPIG